MGKPESAAETLRRLATARKAERKAAAERQPSHLAGRIRGPGPARAGRKLLA
jgi:hypothetical protein